MEFRVSWRGNGGALIAYAPFLDRLADASSHTTRAASACAASVVETMCIGTNRGFSESASCHSRYSRLFTVASSAPPRIVEWHPTARGGEAVARPLAPVMR